MIIFMYKLLCVPKTCFDFSSLPYETQALHTWVGTSGQIRTDTVTILSRLPPAFGLR